MRNVAAAGLGGMSLYSPPVQAMIQKLMLGDQGPMLREAAKRSIIPQSITEDDRK